MITREFWDVYSYSRRRTLWAPDTRQRTADSNIHATLTLHSCSTSITVTSSAVGCYYSVVLCSACVLWQESYLEFGNFNFNGNHLSLLICHTVDHGMWTHLLDVSFGRIFWTFLMVVSVDVFGGRLYVRVSWDVLARCSSLFCSLYLQLKSQ